MKKDRNCGCGGSTPYPVYQMQTPMMPMGPMMQNQMMQGMQMPMMQNTIPMMNQGSSQSTSIEQQLSSLNSQFTNLERRVSTLESLIGSSNMGTNYNTSNFQMM